MDWAKQQGWRPGLPLVFSTITIIETILQLWNIPPGDHYIQGFKGAMRCARCRYAPPSSRG
jgi:hypothetical protein